MITTHPNFSVRVKVLYHNILTFYSSQKANYKQTLEPLIANLASTVFHILYNREESIIISQKFTHDNIQIPSSHGGLGVECLLHKRHDSVPGDRIPLGAYLRMNLYGRFSHPL